MSRRASKSSLCHGFDASLKLTSPRLIKLGLAKLGFVCAALVCVQAASTASVQAADLYGARAYDRYAEPAGDPRYTDTYEIPRRDRFQEADVRPDLPADAERAGVNRNESGYDPRYERYERYDDEERYERTAPPAGYGRHAARNNEPPLLRDERYTDRYADRVPGDPPVSLKDSAPLEEPFAGPSRYQDDRYEAYRRDRQHRENHFGREAERDHRPIDRYADGYIDRYADGYIGRERACLGRRDIKRALRSEGWRGLVGFDLGRDRARVSARRTYDGRRFILTLDSCTGDIIAALPVDPRYNRW